MSISTKKHSQKLCNIFCIIRTKITAFVKLYISDSYLLCNITKIVFAPLREM